MQDDPRGSYLVCNLINFANPEHLRIGCRRRDERDVRERQVRGDRRVVEIVISALKRVLGESLYSRKKECRMQEATPGVPCNRLPNLPPEEASMYSCGAPGPAGGGLVEKLGQTRMYKANRDRPRTVRRRIGTPPSSL